MEIAVVCWNCPLYQSCWCFFRVRDTCHAAVCVHLLWGWESFPSWSTMLLGKHRGSECIYSYMAWALNTNGFSERFLYLSFPYTAQFSLLKIPNDCPFLELADTWFFIHFCSIWIWFSNIGFSAKNMEAALHVTDLICLNRPLRTIHCLPMYSAILPAVLFSGESISISRQASRLTFSNGGKIHALFWKQDLSVGRKKCGKKTHKFLVIYFPVSEKRGGMWNETCVCSVQGWSETGWHHHKRKSTADSIGGFVFGDQGRVVQRRLGVQTCVPIHV